MRALLIRIWLFLSVLWVSFGGALAVSNDPFSAGLRDEFASLPSGVAQIGLSPIEYGRLALYLILIFLPTSAALGAWRNKPLDYLRSSEVTGDCPVRWQGGAVPRGNGSTGCRGRRNKP